MTEVFVFGSNLAGRHGAGAALYARMKYRAEYGVGRGRTGDAYAIPTKDADLRSLPLAEIEVECAAFARYAAEHHDELFLLTPIGCGLAGNDPRAIAAIFRRVVLPFNVRLHNSWMEHFA